jgi:hypothetical protein
MRRIPCRSVTTRRLPTPLITFSSDASAPELVLGGCDRVRTPDGQEQEQLLYRDAFDLLSKTLSFYENTVCNRLNHDFQEVARHLAVHFAGTDPYADAIRCNLDRCVRIVAEGPFRFSPGFIAVYAGCCTISGVFFFPLWNSRIAAKLSSGKSGSCKMSSNDSPAASLR